MSGYLPALLTLLRSIDVRPGEVIHVQVLHDESCPMLAGVGVCDCEPIVVAPRLSAHIWPNSRAQGAAV